MKRLLIVLTLFAAPLCAVDVKLVGEKRSFEPKELRLEGNVVHWKKGRKDKSAALSDFERPSQFLIKRRFTGKAAVDQLELARFALHRGLFIKARSCLKLIENEKTLVAEMASLTTLIEMLEADSLLLKARNLLDESKPDEARPLLQRVINDFSQTLAADEARILLGTLDRVALEALARDLEKKARAAQKDADASEAKKRAPVDDWLDVLQKQIKENRDIFADANANCIAQKLHLGLPKFEDAANSLVKLRKSLEKNTHELKYRGQPARAQKIDGECKNLLVNTFERWGYYLYKRASYKRAAEVCNLGLKLDASDRRLLRLKLDIDDWREAQE